MTKNELLRSLEEMMSLKNNSLSADTQLENIMEWDSMAFLSLIALFDSQFQKKATISILQNFKTPSDIFSYLEITHAD